MFTLALLLALAAFILTLAAALNKAPLWVAVLLLTIALLLQSIPIR